jgi:outer membrane protein OmpA-like peptidoglycan-associated protein
MARRVGKCTNYSGCKLAYRNEKISAETKDFRCPECGDRLESIEPRKRSSSTLVVGMGVAAILLAAGVILWNMRAPGDGQHELIVVQTPTPTAAPTLVSTPTLSPTPVSTPRLATASTQPPEDAATPIDLDVNRPELADVKRAALQRIDMLPDVSQADKDALYRMLTGARGIGQLLSVPFETNLTTLTPQDIAYLQNQVDHREVKKILLDPTVILLILGYADTQGNQRTNEQISLDRAQTVMNALRDQCGVQKLMLAVPMGGTDLLDPRNLAKNRVAEVWGVLP